MHTVYTVNTGKRSDGCLGSLTPALLSALLDIQTPPALGSNVTYSVFL